MATKQQQAKSKKRRRNHSSSRRGTVSPVSERVVKVGGKPQAVIMTGLIGMGGTATICRQATLDLQRQVGNAQVGRLITGLRKLHEVKTGCTDGCLDGVQIGRKRVDDTRKVAGAGKQANRLTKIEKGNVQRAAPRTGGRANRPRSRAMVRLAAGGGSNQQAARPVSKPTLQKAFALNTLRKVFGRAAWGQIEPGRIHVVENQAALYAEYDRSQIASGSINPDTNRVWKIGDTARYYDRRNLRMGGFQSGYDFFIDSTHTDPSTTLHEMLHVNMAPNTRFVLGDVISEGATQRFAMRALKATGHSTTGTEGTYVQERDIVNRLVTVVTEADLEHAYFNNPHRLVATYHALMGQGTFKILKKILKRGAAGFETAREILQPPSTQTRIKLVNKLLDWIVSDYDINDIARIWKTSSIGDKLAIKEAIKHRVKSLSNLRQRFRLIRILRTY